MASWKKVQRILEKLSERGLYPEYSGLDFDLRLDWEHMPKGIDPIWGFLSEDRAKRKRRQVENFIQLALSLLEGGEVVVDFCSGSGHLSLPMAYMFPKCHFILVERNPIPLEIGKRRIKDSGLKNVELFNGYIQNFQSGFDLGVALHACGEATDLAQIRCLENNATYILCPCDIGYIQNRMVDNQESLPSLSYPRSKSLSGVLTADEYKTLASAADWTCWDFDSEQGRLGKLCMGYINLDRNLAAEEIGYKTYLFSMHPRESTPKNDIICGYPEGKKGNMG